MATLSEPSMSGSLSVSVWLSACSCQNHWKKPFTASLRYRNESPAVSIVALRDPLDLSILSVSVYIISSPSQ